MLTIAQYSVRPVVRCLCAVAFDSEPIFVGIPVGRQIEKYSGHTRCQATGKSSPYAAVGYRPD